MQSLSTVGHLDDTGVFRLPLRPPWWLLPGLKGDTSTMHSAAPYLPLLPVKESCLGSRSSLRCFLYKLLMQSTSPDLKI